MIKINESIFNYLPCFEKSQINQAEFEVTIEDWDKYVAAMRAYTTAYKTLKNKAREITK
jgi:hypothetical protein